jgi:hypothetical protein
MDNQQQKQPRDIIVAFRLTPTEACHIDSAGASLKSPRRRADFCRSASLHYAKQKVPPPAKPVALPSKRKPTHDIVLLSRLLAEVGKIGSDFNQLTTIAKARGAVPTVNAVMAVSDELAGVRKQLAVALGGTADEAPQ